MRQGLLKQQKQLHKINTITPDDVARIHREQMLEGQVIDAINYTRLKAQESNDTEFYNKFNKLFYEIQK